MDLLREVSAYIERHQLFEPGSCIVVGVSGGPDSVTLLHLLRRLAESWNLYLHVAHLHHGIRGDDADEDMRFVVQLAESAGLDCTTELIDVPALAGTEGLALEETARRARYAFLTRVARAVGAHTIAVGHNADDQAETVLMHLLRGAGLSGLRGMLPVTHIRDYRLLPLSDRPATNTVLIRPLLNTPRADIEAYCRNENLETRFDRSNLDTTYFRNRLRHEVLPNLAEINPQISERLRNLAEVVRADYGLIQEFVRVAQDTLLIAAHPDALVFDLTRWRGQPLAVQRALVRRSAYRLRRTLRDVDFEHVEQAVDVAQRGGTGAQAILPHNLELTVGYRTLTISEAGALHLPAERPWLEPGDETPVNVPGITLMPGGWVLRTEILSAWDIEDISENPNPLAAWIDARSLGQAPILRTREEGDRFAPQGMRGSEVRLSDFLINTKLPRPWRDHLPLLVSGGRILWVSGLRLSEQALVRPSTRRVIHLRFYGS